MRKILVLGALGQIGTELTSKFVDVYGSQNVVASDIKDASPFDIPYEKCDATDAKAIASLVDKYKVNTIVNLVAVLSAVGEANPALLWHVNMTSLYNALEVAREKNLTLFTPSSIASFGPNTPRIKTPQDTIQRPNTIYGVSKVAGELLSDYYHTRFGVDTRGVRFPGLISNVALPGGGTTDYAVHIYYDAVKSQSFECNLKADTYMDMMYMPDALNAICQLLEADSSKFKHRNAFNIAAMSFCPEDIKKSIQKFMPEFTMTYNVDPIKQAIADSWPDSMDDSAAREEWGWKPSYDLDAMTKDMLETLKNRI